MPQPLHKVLGISVDLGNRKGHRRARVVTLSRIVSNTEGLADPTNGRANGADGCANPTDPAQNPSSSFKPMKSKEENGSRDADDGPLHSTDPAKKGVPSKGRKKASKPLKKKQFSDVTEEKF